MRKTKKKMIKDNQRIVHPLKSHGMFQKTLNQEKVHQTNIVAGTPPHDNAGDGVIFSSQTAAASASHPQKSNRWYTATATSDSQKSIFKPPTSHSDPKNIRGKDQKASESGSKNQPVYNQHLQPHIQIQRNNRKDHRLQEINIFTGSGCKLRFKNAH